MTVGELMEELKYFDDDLEIELYSLYEEIDFECEYRIKEVSGDIIPIIKLEMVVDGI